MREIPEVDLLIFELVILAIWFITTFGAYYLLRWREMREIKFRGKARGEWVHGSLIVCEDGHCVINWVDGLRHVSTDIGVVPETVGQFTGLYDANGREIYEGDIVTFSQGTEPSAVRWDNEFAYFVIMKSLLLGHACKAVRVIGNIHDYPQLLEEEHDRRD